MKDSLLFTGNVFTGCNHPVTCKHDGKKWNTYPCKNCYQKWLKEIGAN